MKLRRLISLLLVSVYLFAVGGPAYGALTCECVSFKSHAAHVCCHHCVQECGDSPACGAFSASCCDDHHSIEIELYTRTSSNDEDRTTCPILALPTSLAAECPCPAHIPFLREKAAERRAPFIGEAHVRGVGLRAPPVLA